MNNDKIKLSEWAKSNGKTYKQGWTMVQNGTFPGKVEKSDNGSIFVLKENKPIIVDNFGKFATPSLIGNEITASTRRNKAATSTPTDSYFHIDSGVVPFQFSSSSSQSNISISDAIRLCQKCYWNFSIFRNTIDVMTEFSTNKIYLRGGNPKSRKFVSSWLESIKYLDLEDKFFREYYRSSNVFIKRFDAKLKESDIRKLSRAFNLESLSAVSLPVKFIILNPADIAVESGLTFSDSRFVKILNPYELGRLKNPKTDEEKRFLSSLPKEAQEAIKSGSNTVMIPLDPSEMYAVFYKKQDYEPLAVPMGYPVLKDINAKAEMKSIDMAVARTMNNVILLINMGYESKNGEYMFDQQAAEAMKELFASESVGKTLVSDFNTKVEHKIPQIGDFLDPKKYTIINEDIKTGLNHILSGSSGDSKFANQFIQTQIFIQRLQQARESFINEFLFPEIKRICDIMNFRDCPRPFFENFDLKDPVESNRVITRLAEIGLLTPEETFQAMETGRLPTPEESVESQAEFRKLRDKGYYEPIAGGPNSQLMVQEEQGKVQMKIQEQQQQHDAKQSDKQRKHDAENPVAPAPQIHINAPGIKKQAGKPAGKAGPNSKTRKSSPMKASIDEAYSLNKIKDNIVLSIELQNLIEKELCKKHNKKSISEEEKTIANQIKEVIMYSEDADKWISCASKYINNPIIGDEVRALDIENIAISHSVSPFLASILFASKKSDDVNE